MGIRAQPLELEVLPDDPFRNDLLARREPVELLTGLLQNLEGPCVIAVDSPWGTGKTSFLKMLSAHLLLEGFTVASFNAWDTDFSDEPFPALTTELLEALEPRSASRLREGIRATRAAAVEVLKHSVPGAIRIASSGLLNLDPLIEGEIAEALTGYAEQGLKRYREGNEALSAFRAQLTELVSIQRETNDARPVIVIIDELDRCRPLYAIELLESAKHLFAVDGVIFVFGIDRDELAHSVRAIYGAGFGASAYLRRFFDVDYSLPSPSRDAFIEGLLAATKIPAYCERTLDREGKRLAEIVGSMTKKMLGGSRLSLREIGKGIHRLGLVLASLPDNRLAFAPSASTLVVLRTLNADLYRQLINGTVSDLHVLDQVFSDPLFREVRKTHSGRLFEATIMLGAGELGRPSPVREKLEALDKEYADANPDETPEQVRHARDVLKLASALASSSIHGGVGFKYSIDRLELVSPDLEHSTSTE